MQERNPVHLRSAAVDLQGNLIAIGTMTYPPSSGGEFPATVTEQLRISRPSYGVTPCKAARDVSGFLASEKLGPCLSLPIGFHDVVRHALRFGAEEPVRMALGSQGGALIVEKSSTSTLRQHLSDWQLRIQQVEDDIRVEISAALHANYLNPIFTSERNFWLDQPGSRVTIAYTVDAVTRLAAFGSLIGRGQKVEGGEPAVPGPSTASTLDIENAAVGVGTVYGSREGRWINFGDLNSGRPTIALTEHTAVRRLPNGFLSRGSYKWPRIWLYGADFLSLAKVPRDPFLRLSGNSMTAIISDDGRDGWHKGSSETAVEVSIGTDGLALDYFLRVGGRPLEGRVMLGWETLILRYPELAWAREDVLAIAAPREATSA